MQCPIDGEILKMTERAGVEIDYCPRCRGIWLDRGELDKILAYKTPAARADTLPDERTSKERDRDRDRYKDRDRDRDRDDDKKRKRDKSSKDFYSKRKDHIDFIKDIFDF